MESFESKIEKAKEILAKLGGQNLSLKEGLSLYKEGIKELDMAQKMLEEAKLEYQQLKIEASQNGAEK